jgi:DNA-binding NarL/FixJ family response regulator
MEVVAEAGNGRRAVELAKKLSPNLVIMDIAMPELNGMEAARQILTVSPHTKIIALSMHSDRRYVSEILKVGALGYLLKECAFEELDRAIRTVISGQIYLSPGIAHVVVEDYVQKLSGKDDSPTSMLSPREREILQLLADGKNVKQIALQLHISGKTVETHRRNIMEKLDIHSLPELTKFAIREGLTTVES